MKRTTATAVQEAALPAWAQAATTAVLAATTAVLAATTAITAIRTATDYFGKQYNCNDPVLEDLFSIMCKGAVIFCLNDLWSQTLSRLC